EIHRESDLPSRVADNMLWLGRYVERTEGVLRVLRSLLNRLNSETRLDIIQEFPFLLRILASLEIVPSSFVSPEAAYNIQNIETELKAAMFSPQRPGSIRNLMQHVKRVAASVRDRLSNDSWHVLGRMENDLAKMSFQKNNQISDAQELVSEMILTISAFAGLALESMTRGMGWRFMDMGRRLERADYTITLLQSLFFPRENTCLSGKRSQSHDLEALLEVADSTITYHTRYRTILQKEPIVDLLLLDELNPRSAGFQMTRLSEHVEALPGNIPRSFRTKEEKITLDLTTQLRLADISHLMAMNQAGELPRLFQLLKRLKKGIQSLGDQITQHYLSRIETEQQMRISFDTDGFVGDDGAQGWKKS
ncbi:MAG: alpha-E domain-containing protein, partial [Desulfotignum sp.]